MNLRPSENAIAPRTAGLPSTTAQAAIVLGLLLGTWMLLNGAEAWITGHYVPLPQIWLGWRPAEAGAVFTFGVLWMLVPNLYLYRNRLCEWKAMIVLIVVTSWSVGLIVTSLLGAQLILLVLPVTRRGRACLPPQPGRASS
ncbi:MAG: hypothetical protein ACRD1Y_11445 [Terriglobales bacterium]